MDRPDELESRFEGHRVVLFQLYNELEELNKTYDIRKSHREKSLDDLQEALKPLKQNQEVLNDIGGGVDRGDYLVFTVALIFRLFCLYGPGQVETAWKAVVDSYRRNLAKNGGGVE